MKTQIENSIEELVHQLPLKKDQHARSTAVYQSYATHLRPWVESLFRGNSLEKQPFGPFGKIAFPYFKMGNKDSLDLFDMDELIIFSFYWANRKIYKNVLDIGANIGLHSLILSKCGYHIQSFEPDPVHFKQLQYVLEVNQAKNVTPHCAAVSSRSGQAEFTRVLGNTTSSHLSGSKNPYGELERFTVPLFDIKELIKKADLIKMDVEGHEAEVLLATSKKDWERTDALVEIGSPEAASLIYTHLAKEGISSFAQKLGWKKITKLADMPTSYKEGSLFISNRPAMPWG
jgi:FkbM family methyltransferase